MNLEELGWEDVGWVHMGQDRDHGVMNLRIP
jgi:hypothetical protein